MAKAEEQKKEPEQKDNDTEKKENETEQKKEEKKVKGFWKNLGLGAKIGIAAAGTALIAGATWLIGTLLGKDDEEEPKAIETSEDTEK